MADRAEQRASDAESAREEAELENFKLVTSIGEIETARLDAERALAAAEQRAERYKAALLALAKVQYDGTVDGLRYQIEHEDWGDVLDPIESTAAYELTLAALEEPQET